MLSLLHPTILSSVLEYPGGLLTVRHTESGKLLLILKLQKEYILAARIRGGFSFYLAPLPSSSGLTVALATAFFDDGDEPLIVRTPLFDEALGNELLELLTYDEFEVYFFDEHGREWMGHQAFLHDAGSILAAGDKFGLLTYHPRTVDGIYQALDNWFGNRTAEDDAKAIKVVFRSELTPPNIFIQNSRSEDHDFHGSGGYSHSSLERQNPGYFQERDIVACLKRAFPGERIALNPMRRDTGKEFVDVIAWNDTHLLLVQAKDSPNTEASLSRTIDRKRRTSHGQIEKGVKQAKGAAEHARRHSKLELSIDKIDLDLTVGDKRLISIVVVQEIFSDEGETFVSRYREMNGVGDVFVLLDYAAFNSFCHEFRNETLLLAALTDYSSKIIAGNAWLDPRPYVLECIQKRLAANSRSNG
ncbi:MULTISPECIES: hypothetical protein [unclassified Ensifer]|uniref:hypothetical protein n=1 Tax=unclassified Ensifer TaxID=2633371 RepID=UPI00070A7A02|nr:MULTISPECIES: hypothetical protein [unclassified Ensifer]KQW42172.1 hypothetical protein ASD02_35800 [Ensifer sp. Root1252]KRC74985.1 hypothetical protein ASE32_31220 [Ensifer sp. Root231]KRC96454.1 hypothetical protein ASE47_31590 [Ensifer sp. Root258]